MANNIKVSAGLQGSGSRSSDNIPKNEIHKSQADVMGTNALSKEELRKFNKGFKDLFDTTQGLTKEMEKLKSVVANINEAGMGGSGGGSGGGGGGYAGGGNGISGGIASGALMTLGYQGINQLQKMLTTVYSGVGQKVESSFSLEEMYTRMYGQGSLSRGTSVTNQIKYPGTNNTAISLYNDPLRSSRYAAKKMGLMDEEKNSQFISGMSVMGDRDRNTSGIMNSMGMMQMAKQNALKEEELILGFRGYKSRHFEDQESKQRVLGLSSISKEVGGDNSIVFLRELVKLMGEQVTLQDKNIDAVMSSAVAAAQRGASAEESSAVGRATGSMGTGSGINIAKVMGMKAIERKTRKHYEGRSAGGAAALANVSTMLSESTGPQIEKAIEDGIIPMEEVNYLEAYLLESGAKNFSELSVMHKKSMSEGVKGIGGQSVAALLGLTSSTVLGTHRVLSAVKNIGEGFNAIEDATSKGSVSSQQKIFKEAEKGGSGIEKAFQWAKSLLVDATGSNTNLLTGADPTDIDNAITGFEGEEVGDRTIAELTRDGASQDLINKAKRQRNANKRIAIKGMKEAGWSQDKIDKTLDMLQGESNFENVSSRVRRPNGGKPWGKLGGAGVWQITRPTWNYYDEKVFGKTLPTDDRFDVEKNNKMGMAIWQDKLDLAGGDYRKALMLYKGVGSLGGATLRDVEKTIKINDARGSSDSNIPRIERGSGQVRANRTSSLNNYNNAFLEVIAANTSKNNDETIFTISGGSNIA